MAYLLSEELCADVFCGPQSQLSEFFGLNHYDSSSFPVLCITRQVQIGYPSCNGYKQSHVKLRNATHTQSYTLHYSQMFIGCFSLSVIVLANGARETWASWSCMIFAYTPANSCGYLTMSKWHAEKSTTTPKYLWGSKMQSCRDSKYLIRKESCDCTSAAVLRAINPG